MHVFMKKCENCVNGIEKICNAVYNASKAMKRSSTESVLLQREVGW